MQRKLLELVAAIVAVAACGGGSSAPATNGGGTIDGRVFAAKEAIATTATGSGFTFGGPAAYVEITDYLQACAEESGGRQPTAGQRLVFGLASYDAAGTPAPPKQRGTFPVHQSGAGAPGTNIAQVYYDAGCQKANPHAGLSGTVTVNSVDADGTLDGSFDLVITCDGFSTCSGPDANVAGSFHAVRCLGLNVNATPGCG